ncbi:MAG: hypothetical protein IPM39_27720 [Chloroflexi bacterium]|nr:hypothetical protein [Chloroflexota bacterium]
MHRTAVREDQRQFLTDMALTFLTTLFSDDLQAVDEAMARLNINPTALTPNSLFEQPARVMPWRRRPTACRCWFRPAKRNWQPIWLAARSPLRADDFLLRGRLFYTLGTAGQ